MNETTNGQTCFILQGSGFYKHSLDNPNLKCFLVVLFDNLLYHEAARREIRYLRIQRKTLEDLYILGRKLRVVFGLSRIICKVSMVFIYQRLSTIAWLLNTILLGTFWTGPRKIRCSKWIRYPKLISSLISPEYTNFLYNNQTKISIFMQISINTNIWLK